MDKRLLVLGSLGEFVELVKLAKRRGYYTIVCDGYADGPAKHFADKAYNIDVRDPQAIAEMCKAENVNGIIGSFSDLLFEQITKVADLAGLKWYATPDMLPYYRDKSAAKSLFDKLGIRTPRHVRLEKDFADEELGGMRFPLVVKALNGYGSKGIVVADSIDEIRKNFDAITERSDMSAVIAEEYSAGKEHNMMCWVVEGKVHCISIADREKNPRVGNSVPLNTRLVYPAKDIRQVYDEALAVLQKFVDATDQKSGAVSMQFFYNDNGVEVCEIAGRMLGYEHELITYSGDLDVEKLLLDYVYDETTLKETLEHHDPFFSKHYAGLYFMANDGAVIADQSPLRELANHPAVAQCILFYNDGETVNNMGRNPYFARYYITAPSRAELDELTQYFYDHAKAYDAYGNNIMIPFQLED